MTACSNFFKLRVLYFVRGQLAERGAPRQRALWNALLHTLPRRRALFCRPGAAGVGFLMSSADLAIRARASAHFQVLGGQRNRCVGVLRLCPPRTTHSTIVSSAVV